MEWGRLLDRYLRAYELAATPRARDFAVRSIYVFEKYCKRCNSGMKIPVDNARRTIRKLFKNGFCSDECEEMGERVTETSNKSFKPSHSGSHGNEAMEDFIDLSRELSKMGANEKPFVRMLREVDATYNLLSEKLSAMELLTHEMWEKSKWYFWKRKACV